MLTAHFHGIQRFVLVRSMSLEDASVRLQSEPIFNGLRKDGADVVLHTPNPLAPLTIYVPTCVFFHYADQPAIDTIRNRVVSDVATIVVCLSCDIYSYKPYMDVHSITDLFIAPTELHRDILSSQVYKPVYYLPECVDPVSVAACPANARGQRQRRLVWFGYPESFMKSMTSLMPIIADNEMRRKIDSFTVVTNKSSFLQKFGNPFSLTIVEYDTINFAELMLDYDYSVLSHFSLDLSINSLIKSPNKLVTSLVSGLIPLCSSTPNYKAILDRYGLQDFTFSSPGQFGELLERINPKSDDEYVSRSKIVDGLHEELESNHIYEKFLTILELYKLKGNSRYGDLEPQDVPAERVRLRFKEHVRDLLPSALRSIRDRLHV